MDVIHRKPRMLMPVCGVVSATSTLVTVAFSQCAGLFEVQGRRLNELRSIGLSGLFGVGRSYEDVNGEKPFRYRSRCRSCKYRNASR